MPRKHIDALLKSKILVGVIAGIALMLGVIQVAQGFIDTRNYSVQVARIIKEKTGRDITIKGKVTISLLPRPTIYVPGVELQGGDKNKPTPAMTIEMLSINASLISIFSGAPKISRVHLEKPVIEIEQTRENIIYWDWFNAGLIKALATPGNNEDPITFAIHDGKVLYHDVLTDHYLSAQNIMADGEVGAHFDVGGTFGALGYNFGFNIDTAPDSKRAVAGTVVPLRARLVSDEKKSKALLEGSLDVSSKALGIDGVLTVDIDDLMLWSKRSAEEKNTLLSQITNEAIRKTEEKIVLPIKLTGDWKENSSAIKLSNFKLQGVNSEGWGEVSIDWSKVFSVAADLTFSTLDYNQWRLFYDRLFQSKNVSSATYRGMDEPSETTFPERMRVAVNFAAEKVYVGSQTWRNAKLSAELDRAAVTINQFGIELPGQSTLSLFGVISQGSGVKGLRFEGSMETQGASLRNLVTVFDESAGNLPEAGLGDFYARANLYISPDQVRLSEADVKINALRLSGGLVAYFDSNPRVEADVRLKDINFDYFRNLWREKQIKTGAKDFFLKFDKSSNFSWLKKLQTTIDFKVNVDRFTFIEREGSSASFRLFAREGEFGIYNMRFYYPGNTLEASFGLDVNGEQPFMNVLLNTNELNSNYFSMTPDSNHEERVIEMLPQADVMLMEGEALTVIPPDPTKSVVDSHIPSVSVPILSEKPQWSEALIDMSWMEGMDGTFDISIGRLTHGKYNFDRLKFKARLENNLMNLQTLSFLYWQGRCEVTGSLYGGKVPGFALGFTLFNAELYDMLHSLTGRDNVTGKISVSGSLSTSGVNYLSWISQLEAKMLLAARGVKVGNLNLQGVVDAVAASRTASDVLNNVNLAVVNGSTEFSVDGTTNVRNGVIRTPGITLKTGTITGNLTGEIALIPWTIDLTSFFQFPAMTSETIPTMTMQLAGPIASPKLQTDTSSLEAYVVKKITN